MACINKETQKKREKALAAYDRISDDDDDIFISRSYISLQKKMRPLSSDSMIPPNRENILKSPLQWKSSNSSVSGIRENEPSEVKEIPPKNLKTDLDVRKRCINRPIMTRKPLLRRSVRQDDTPTNSTRLSQSKLPNFMEPYQQEASNKTLSQTCKKVPVKKKTSWPRNVLGRSSYSNVNKRCAPLSSKGRQSTIEETFRIEEKRQYQQLLDQCSLKQSPSPRLSSFHSVVQISPDSSTRSSPLGHDVRWSRSLSPQSNKSESECENILPISMGCNRFFGSTEKSVNKEYSKDHRSFSNHRTSPIKQTPLSDITMRKELKKKNTITDFSESMKSYSLFGDEDVFHKILPKHTYSKKKESGPIPVVDLCHTDSDTLDSSFQDSDSDSIEVVDEFYRDKRDTSSLDNLFSTKKLNDTKLSTTKKSDYHRNASEKIENINIRDENLKSERMSASDLLNNKVEVRMERLGFAYASRPKCRLEQSFKKPSLLRLTAEMQNQIDAVLAPYPKSEVVVEKFNISITRRDLATLKGLNWLNDEIINFYMNLIMERSSNRKNLPKVYVFSTFFYPKLYHYGHKSVSRWTKKVDIFSYDILLVPIHLDFHWCMAIVDFKKRCINYYDSMLGDNDACLQTLLEYLEAEHMDKKNTLYSSKAWKLQSMKNIPEQMNGSDCGVFSCKFAEYTSRLAPLNFKQEDMPYFRRQMVYEIINGKLCSSLM